MDFEKYLIDTAKKAEIDIDPDQGEKFRIYKELLTETNKVMNLTALTEDRDIALKHFIDSISPLKFMDFSGKKAVDVGTGAGFPSLPVKIMCPDMELTLLDSLQKRIDFLKYVCGKINVKNVEFVHSRAEDGGQMPAFREKFDVCFSRAVASLPVLCEYCLPLLKTGGIFVALKGPMLSEELKASENALKTLGGKVICVKEFHLPDTDIIHNIAFIEKICKTPEKYPRKSSKIQKNPL